MLVKFISENAVEPYKGLVEADGVVYTNNEEKAKASGYKPLIMETRPEVSEDTFLSLYYEETDTAVYGRWKEEKITEVI